MRAAIGMLIFAALSVGPAAPALAQDAVIDPGPGTPAGTQYQIPVDTARQDAAPHPQAPKRHNGTTLQSENGFGSSSQVPSAAPVPVPVAATPAPKPAPVHHRRKPAHRKQHTTAKPAPAPAPAPKPVAQPAPAAAPSSAPPASSSDAAALWLLLGSVAVAGGVGSAARRRG